jgi:hypothetical protein
VLAFYRPTPPKINNGLKEVPPGLLATAIPADLANLNLLLEIVKTIIAFSDSIFKFNSGITNGF